jgi:adenine deaminase
MTNKVPSQAIRFHLALSSEKYLAYYKGHAQSIQTRSIDNKRIRFPANAIREFLTHEGIYGLFEIQFDENNKLIKINKIS